MFRIAYEHPILEYPLNKHNTSLLSRSQPPSPTLTIIHLTINQLHMRSSLYTLILFSLLLLMVHCQADQQEGDQTQQQHQESDNHFHSITSKEFWINALFALFLCSVAGFCSGNTVGLLSISTLDLEIQLQNGTEVQKKQAKTILAVVSNHHLLLSTLLLANALAMETLPIVMHSLVPAWAAILLSTVVVLIAGEIVPQAMCTGPKKMRIAEICAPLIGILIKVLWIACYPLSKALDWLFGEHSHTRIEKKDLKNLLKIQDNTLKRSESVLLTSILSLREHRVDKIMAPLKEIYMLNANSILDDNLVAEIRKNNHSFIPLYQDRRNNIIGIMKTKELTLAAFDKGNYGKKLTKIVNVDSRVLSLYQDTNLLEILMLFQDKAERVALVVNQKRKITPGLESIYYSKSDMVYKKEEKIEILGMVMLSALFEAIAAWKITEESSAPRVHNGEFEMNDITTTLLDNK